MNKYTSKIKLKYVITNSKEFVFHDVFDPTLLFTIREWFVDDLYYYTSNPYIGYNPIQTHNIGEGNIYIGYNAILNIRY